MKLHFEANQQHQLEAIRSVVGLFEGQPLKGGDFSFEHDMGNSLFRDVVANNRQISEEQILENLKAIQKENDISESEELEGMHFSIEMETGTGKTYVYLRTIYELNKNYGFKKFVIVVPSVAIREGVIKNLKITHDHFQSLFDKTPVHFEVYDSRRLSNLRGFTISNSIQILVLNIDSFAKSENVINRINESRKKPIEFIQNAHPIVIVDEPQNMETEIRKKAIENLNYLCTLRYSATHKDVYNLVYRLDPVRAYDLGLVKQIEVDSIVTENDFNEAYIKVKKIGMTTKPFAQIEIDCNDPKGVKRKTVKATAEKDLYQLSKKREIYREGYQIVGIDASAGYLELSNGEILYEGDGQGSMAEEIMKVQIKQTVAEHFVKERALKAKGIKVLSLFFIDRVANYRAYDEAGNRVMGKFALWFEEAFQEIAQKNAYRDLIPFNVKQVHNGYFSQDKKGKWKDTKGTTAADDDTFKLIMEKKEELLDQTNPLRFIFSHSALREGWDNPNVFQICTLNETTSEMKKRQEIGRGLRLAVNQEGNRVFGNDINRLTVIANESYEDWAKALQNQIEEECGVSFSGRIKNKAKRVPVKYKKGFELDEKFKEIWERIKHKTRYRVEYETSELIEKAAKAIQQMPEIKKAIIRSEKAGVKFGEIGILKATMSSFVINTVREFQIPDILFYLQGKTGLTRSTLIALLKDSNRLDDVLINPQLFLDYASTAINDVLRDLIVNGIKYEKIGGREYEMRLFEDYEIHKNENTFEVSNAEKTIYENLIPLDSGVENDFAKECESRDDIEFYFKLPFWFKIKTPLGMYNPDWALIKKNEEKIYFVAETKSAGQELRPSEKQKIVCGEAHFKEFNDVEYRQVSSVRELDY